MTENKKIRGNPRIQYEESNSVAIKDIVIRMCPPSGDIISNKIGYFPVPNQLGLCIINTVSKEAVKEALDVRTTTQPSFARPIARHLIYGFLLERHSSKVLPLDITPTPPFEHHPDCRQDFRGVPSFRKSRHERVRLEKHVSIYQNLGS